MSHLLNCRSRPLTSSLLWFSLNSHKPRLHWNSVLMGHCEHLYGNRVAKKRGRHILNLILRLMCKLHCVTELHSCNSKIKFQVEDNRTLNQVQGSEWIGHISMKPTLSLFLVRKVTGTSLTLKGAGGNYIRTWIRGAWVIKDHVRCCLPHSYHLSLLICSFSPLPSNWLCTCYLQYCTRWQPPQGQDSSLICIPALHCHMLSKCNTEEALKTY